MLLLCDPNSFSTMEEAYDFFEKELSLPSWFGRNLDALYDCLTDISYPVTLLLPPAQENAVAEKLLPLLQDVEKENPRFMLIRRINDAAFNREFSYIEGDTLALRLIDTYEGKGEELPFYWWEILLKSSNTAVGKISLRLGHNYHSYYNGNIGYEIDEAYRGNHYALSACQLVLPAARYHGMEKLCFTCDYDNVASYKTIEKLGATLVEVVHPPKDWIYYYEGVPLYRIYVLNI